MVYTNNRLHCVHLLVLSCGCSCGCFSVSPCSFDVAKYIISHCKFVPDCTCILVQYHTCILVLVKERGKERGEGKRDEERGWREGKKRGIKRKRERGESLCL